MNSKAIKRQLLAAIAMVLVAAIALGSSTYAWFVASGSVTAEGMTVQVQSEGGIMIKALNSDTAWASVASAKNTNTAKLYPISTYDLTKWYHAKSDSSTDAKSVQSKNDYQEITANLDSYRRMDSFLIRPSSGTPIENAKLLITEVSVSEGDQTENLNKAIRVGVKMTNSRDLATGEKGATYYIYAPRNANTFTLQAAYLDPVTPAVGETPAVYKSLEEKNTPANTDYLYWTGNKIPAADTGIQVDIYVWYEGEDDECKTANLFENKTNLTPDKLTVTVSFAQADLAATSGTTATIT